MKKKPVKKNRVQSNSGGAPTLPKVDSVGYPRPLYGDVEGCLYDIPGYRALGKSSELPSPLEGKNMIPMPDQSKIYSLPGRKPQMQKKDEIETLPLPLTAAGAVLPENYLRLAHPVFLTSEESEETLPPLAYTAITCWQNRNWAAAAELRHPSEPVDVRLLMASVRPELNQAASLDEQEPQRWLESSPSDKKIELQILYFPGVTDRPEEVALWQDFVGKLQPQSIRLENLAVEPESFFKIGGSQKGQPMGVISFLAALKESSPESKLDQVIAYWKEAKKK